MSNSTLPFPDAEPGDEFSNNLFSDLAPLLALFGEQVARQFMSESIGWADSIIFAMAPLGVITAIVGAIRVGGPRWLKAIIGRARENRAIAEAELMSSTSHEVCELWNGQQVVRIMGSPPIRELIHLTPTSQDREDNDEGYKPKIYTLDQAKKEAKLESDDESNFAKRIQTTIDNIRFLFGWLNPGTQTPRDPERPLKSTVTPALITSDAPNISLNLHNRVGRQELHLVAVIGTTLQLGVITYDAFATYYPSFKLSKGSTAMAPYAFPLTSIGTLILVLGMIICSYIIESSTKEENYRAKDADVHMLWLQKAAAVSDQVFDSYAIFAKEKRQLVTTSRRNHEVLNSQNEDSTVSTEILTIFGSTVSVLGFILQFVGLRAMHWSASITQLVATLIMVILRAWVRRGLARRPYAQELPVGHEIDWLATRIAEHEHLLWTKIDPNEPENHPRQSVLRRIWDTIRRRSAPPEFEDPPPGFWTQDCLEWNIVTGVDIIIYEALRDYKKTKRSNNRASKVIEARKHLARLTRWPGNTLDKAISVASAIEAVMDTMFDSKETSLLWSIYASKDQRIDLKLERQDVQEGWKANLAEIEAAISLWLFSMGHKERETSIDPEDHDESAWLRNEVGSKKKVLRLLGPSTKPSCRDMQWWVGNGMSAVVDVKELNDPLLKDLVVPHTDGTGRIFYVADYISDIPKTSDDFNLNEKISLSSHRVMGCTRNNNMSTLATLSDAPLDVLVAQEMFSSFMWAVAKTSTVKLIGGHTTLHQAPDIINSKNGDAWKSFTLQNTTLSKVALSVVRTGLGSLDDIYLSMIPPLSMEGKLPDASAVVELAREQASKYELNRQWKEAGDAYLWAYRTCMDFDFKYHHQAIIKATTALTEFLRLLSITLQVTEQHRDMFMVLDVLENSQSEISQELTKSANRSVLSTLATMYPSQARHEGSKVWDSQLTEVLDFSNDEDFMRAFGWTPLHDAAAEAQDEKLLELLRAGADPNAKDFSGWTPLHYAKGFSAGQWLFQYGAHVDIQGRDGFTPLHSAAKRGIVETVALLIKSGAKLEVQDTGRRTPLHWAAYEGREDVVDLLLKKGADLDSREEHGRTPLHMAACGGYERVVSRLVGASELAKEMMDEDGRTMLHLAAIGGYDSVVETLILVGADIEAKDHVERTALHLAVDKGHHLVIRALLKAGADKEAKNGEGETALQMAARSGLDIIMEEFLEAGADMGAKDEFKRTALHLAVRGGTVAAVKTLLKAGAEINERDRYGHTLLHLAVDNESIEMVELMLDIIVDKDARDQDGETALSRAAWVGNDGVVQVLIMGGAEIQTKNRIDQTPLHKAAECGHTTVVRILVKAGADMEAKDGNGRTVLHSAACAGDKEVIETLLKEGADIAAHDHNDDTALHLAARSGHDVVVEVLLKAGADIEAQNKDERTALLCSVVEGHNTVVGILLKAGAVIEAKDKSGSTSLHLAVEKGHNSIVEAFLNAGISPETENQDGLRSLHLAALIGYDAIVTSLLRAGADKEARNKLGETALNLAARSGCEAVVKLLLEAGADKEAKDQNGQTPLHKAAYGGTEGYPAVVEILLKAGVDMEAKDDKGGETVLHMAARDGHKAVVEVLVQAGGLELESKDTAGETALHKAAYAGRDSVIKVLLEAGADIDAKDAEGRTALDLAVKGDDEDEFYEPGKDYESVIRQLEMSSKTPNPM